MLIGGGRQILETKMDEDSAKVFIIFFNPMIQGFDVLLVQESQHALFELTAALAGDDLDQFNPLVYGLVYDVLEGLVYLVAFVENIV